MGTARAVMLPVSQMGTARAVILRVSIGGHRQGSQTASIQSISTVNKISTDKLISLNYKKEFIINL